MFRRATQPDVSTAQNSKIVRAFSQKVFHKWDQYEGDEVTRHFSCTCRCCFFLRSTRCAPQNIYIVFPEVHNNRCARRIYELILILISPRKSNV